MKSRLSSQIWTLALLTGAGFLFAVGLAVSAGRAAKDGGFFEAIATPAGAGAIAVAITATILLAWRLGSAILSPVNELAEFSERLAAGDSKARADVHSNDEFGHIAENLNRAVALSLIHI